MATDPREEGLVRDLIDHPDDPALPLILADLWQDLGVAGRVQRNHLPGWLRLAWLRTVRIDRGRYRGTTNMHLIREVNSFLAENGHRIHSPLDRCGSTMIAGRLCFVSEALIPFDTCLKLFRPLAVLIGSACAASQVAERGRPGCRRAVLFPPAVLPAKTPARR